MRQKKNTKNKNQKNLEITQKQVKFQMKVSDSPVFRILHFEDRSFSLIPHELIQWDQQVRKTKSQSR